MGKVNGDGARASLTELTDLLADHFKDKDLSSVVVTRAEVDDRLIDYDELPLVRWTAIVSRTRQQGKIEVLVEQAIAISESVELQAWLDKFKVAPPSPPPPPPAEERDPTPDVVSTPGAITSPPLHVDDLLRPDRARKYAVLAFAGLTLSIGLLLVLIQYSGGRCGTANSIYYVTLVMLGLAGAALLFGTMLSYATFAKRTLSTKLEVGAPLIVVALVVAGGFALAPPDCPTPATKQQPSQSEVALENEYATKRDDLVKELTPVPGQAKPDTGHVIATLRRLCAIQKELGRTLPEWDTTVDLANRRYPGMKNRMKTWPECQR